MIFKDLQTHAFTRRKERRAGDELDPFSYCIIKKINTGERGGQEMSWIHFLIVLLRESKQEAGEDERGGQEMSLMNFLIVLLRK